MRHVRRMATGGMGIVIDLPLRLDFVAQLVVPRDLTESEAKRLCACVMTLVIPPPVSQNDEAPEARQ